MGGSGGGYSIGISEAERLKGIAQRKIEEAKQKGSVNVFIPHSWKYDDEYNRLSNLLEGDDSFRFKDYSVSREAPIDADSNRQLREEIQNQIRAASVILIPAGMYAAHSDWIQTEIAIAKEMNKPIIAIYPWGSQKMPKIVSDNAVEIVGWNKDSIINAINRVRGKRNE